MTRAQHVKRRVSMFFWRVFNPAARWLAGIAPWWVVLETTGRRTGTPRRVPLARGPLDHSTAWLICVHGRHASFARNIQADPHVRLKVRGRWRSGSAALMPLDGDTLRRFNTYARLGPRIAGIDPVAVRVDLN